MNMFLLKVLTTIMFLISGIYKIFDPSLSMKKLAKCPFVTINDNRILMLIIFLAGVWEIVASIGVFYGSKQNKVLSVYVCVALSPLQGKGPGSSGVRMRTCRCRTWRVGHAPPQPLPDC